MATFDALIRASRLPRTEAVSLLNHLDSALTREWLIAHGAEPVKQTLQSAFDALAARRRDGNPLAYIVGWREFFGRRFTVNETVLIPRPDTETLVQWALEHLPHNALVLEPGTGSGAIAVSLACEREDLRITATDIDPRALQVASDNARQLGCSDRISFIESDWFSAIDMTTRYDMILSNPPYIAPTDPHLDQPDLRCEPRQALVSDPDGLGAIREIARDAPDRLKPGGWLAIEHGYNQAESVRTFLTAQGLQEVESARDLAGNWRISVGQRPQSM